jgi:hypothetical protein
MKRIYLVWANSDSTEGRGHDVVRYVCSNKVAADDLAKGLGPMGMSDGHVTEDFLLDSRYDLDTKIKEAFIRKEALAKLTPEEIKALGLK